MTNKHIELDFNTLADVYDNSRLSPALAISAAVKGFLA
jgi:hypothetical protein